MEGSQRFIAVARAVKRCCFGLQSDQRMYRIQGLMLPCLLEALLFCVYVEQELMPMTSSKGLGADCVISQSRLGMLRSACST